MECVKGYLIGSLTFCENIKNYNIRKDVLRHLTNSITDETFWLRFAHKLVLNEDIYEVKDHRYSKVKIPENENDFVLYKRSHEFKVLGLIVVNKTTNFLISLISVVNFL